MIRKKLIVSLVVVLLLSGCKNNSKNDSNTTVKKDNPKETLTISKAPEQKENYQKAKMFSLPYGKNMNKIFDLSKEYKNKNHVFVFFATWCPACRHELPMLDAIKDKYSHTRIIAIDAREPVDKVVKYFESNNIGLDVLIDKTGRTFQLYGIRYIPAVLIVDKNGNVRLFGNKSVEEIEKVLKNLK